MLRQVSGLIAAATLAACTGATAPSATNALTANADAQHLGVYSYTVDGDRATMFDQYGMELGQVTVTSPDGDNRVFTAELVDGTTDVLEVYRPMGDGRFLAPITPETLLTATLADSALAKVWAAVQVKFTVRPLSVAPAAPFAPEVLASTAACTGSVPAYSCSGSGCTPLGCAKPANTSLGCTNPSQLPATSSNSASWSGSVGNNYTSQAPCQAAAPSACQQIYGGNSSDWNTSTTRCVHTGINYVANCLLGNSTNSWVASCPRQTCGTSGDYDAVPRLGACSNPGSCTYSSGSVTCTTYH